MALLGLTLAEWFDNIYFDGAASIVIGAILMGVSILLARETLDLLLGESADPHTVASIRTLAGSDPAVTRVGRALTVHFGPEEVVLNLELFFRVDLTMADVAAAIDRIERAIRKRHPEMKYIFLSADAFATTGAH